MKYIFLIAACFSAHLASADTRLPRRIGNVVLGMSMSQLRIDFKTTDMGGRGCNYYEIRANIKDGMLRNKPGSKISVGISGGSRESKIVQIEIPMNKEDYLVLRNSFLDKYGEAVKIKGFDEMGWQDDKTIVLAPPSRSTTISIVNKSTQNACSEDRDF